jgi:hypothetical protein
MNDGPVARVQRIMPAVPEAVFNQWLDPESLAEWMCPRPVRCVSVDLEPRVGGNVRFDVDDSGNLVLITDASWSSIGHECCASPGAHRTGPTPTMVSVVPLPPDLFDEYQNGWARIFDQFAVVLERSISQAALPRVLPSK